MQTRTILVVDDEYGVRELLRRMIESMGYHVVEAADAEGAMDVLERRTVDLALCDIRLPGRDGIWLVDQILSSFPGTLVALATGLVEMDAAVTLRPGVVGYVVKPFRRADLADLIASAFAPETDRPGRPVDLLAAVEAM